MKSYRIFTIWFGAISSILCIIGFVFTIFGFTFFPDTILPRNVLLPWVSAIYGSIMIGWGVTLFSIGKLAFQRKDVSLMKVLLMGIAVWLLIEAVASAYLGVFFNVGVDLTVFILFSIPIVTNIRTLQNTKE
jgi:hypothetical protein